MIAMSAPHDELAFTENKQIKTIALCDSALQSVVARLARSKKARWKDRKPSQQAVYNASWLWLDQLDEGLLESIMVRFLPYMEALMKGEDATPPPAFTDEEKARFLRIEQSLTIGDTIRTPGAKPAHRRKASR